MNMMSDQYIPDEELNALSKEELVGRLISARDYYRADQATIQSLTDQVAKAIGDIEKLNAVIEEKDAAIAEMQAQSATPETDCDMEAMEAELNRKDEMITHLQWLLGEVEAINMKTLCRANHAAKVLRPYQIPEEDKGGQHAAAPSE